MGLFGGISSKETQHLVNVLEKIAQGDTSVKLSTESFSDAQTVKAVNELVKAFKSTKD